MSTTVLLIAAFYGLTFGIKDSKLLVRPRTWLATKSEFFRELLSCSFCTGFHSGYLVYMLYEPFHDWKWRAALLYALASAALSFVIDSVVQFLESKTHG